MTLLLLLPPLNAIALDVGDELLHHESLVLDVLTLLRNNRQVRVNLSQHLLDTIRYHVCQSLLGHAFIFVELVSAKGLLHDLILVCR